MNNKRSIINLFVKKNDIYCHSIIIALCEKEINFSITHIDPYNKPDSFLEINPNGLLPTLLDRELILYEPKIILEYLDDRFPHPPLLPVYPILRAKAKSYFYQIEKDLYPLVKSMNDNNGEINKKSLKELTDSFIALSSLFENREYFLSEGYSLVDCFMSSLLWNINKILDIKFPKQAKLLSDYADIIFTRNSFKKSLNHISYKKDYKELL